MITFEHITKSFGAVPVLQDVSFRVAAGNTLGLIGENGAGKSTLMNILGGNLRPDSGQMRLSGEPYAPLGPRDAANRGVAFIHQETNLFPNLTIAENIFLARFPRPRALPVIKRRILRQRTMHLLGQVGLELSPDTLVERLSPGERQLVEIAGALSLEARLIIFDEPTTSLSAREAESLFHLIGRLHARGASVIYISHTLGDVLRLCDAIVVLRDGAVVGEGPAADFTAEKLISLMVGRSLGGLYPARKPMSPGEMLLEVRGITQPAIVNNISFNVRCGEVVGLSGLMGAGRSELARILFGLDPCERGEVLLRGESITGFSPRGRIRRGLAFLTEDRREDGLCLQATIGENIALVSLKQHARSPLRLLNFASLREAIERIRQAVRLTPSADSGSPLATLSGGNQQKVVLAKWLLSKPAMLILDEPTRGIDVGAKFEIYELIRELTEHGAGVLLISSELEELIGICDRILVMSRGEVRDELRRQEFQRERILGAALTQRS